MDINKIISYIMTTPYNTNWSVLSTMLDEGDWSELKEYVKKTPKNMNHNVLKHFFEGKKQDNRAIVGTAIVGVAII